MADAQAQRWQAAADIAQPAPVVLAQPPKDDTTVVLYNMGTKTYLNHQEGAGQANNDNPVISWNVYIDGGTHVIRSHKVGISDLDTLNGNTYCDCSMDFIGRARMAINVLSNRVTSGMDFWLTILQPMSVCLRSPYLLHYSQACCRKPRLT